MALERRKESGGAWETVEADGNGGSQPFLTATATLASEEILDLLDTPAELVPATPGKIILPIRILLMYGFVTAPYTSSSNLYITTPAEIGGSNLHMFQALAADLEIGYSGAFLAVIQEEAVTTADMVGQPLVVFTPDGAPTGGDGTLTIITVYTLADPP